ncbi:MAG: hypothetical protein L0346_20495, partial [Chloroflexi bacterium]|nr:hypothetical protein [Chloroflexota bacterium]
MPFTARGAYRKKYPPVDAQLVLDELERASVHSYRPRQEVAGRILWNKAGVAVYDKYWSQLTPEQQQQIQAQVEAIAAQAGWQLETAGQEAVYVRPLAANVAEAKSRLANYLQDYDGRPVPAHTVVTQAQLGAYNRSFYDNELAPELAAAMAGVLAAHGYDTEPEEGDYRPRPVAIPTSAEAAIAERLGALATVPTGFGPALLLRDVLAVVKSIAGVDSIGDWQAEQLVQTGVVGQALRKLGFKSELTWCQPYHFQPLLGDDQPHRVILKEVRVQRDPEKTLSLAQGLAVYTPAVAIDDMEDTLVYLEMIGPKQSVKANWAALVGGGKVHWFGRQRVQLDGMKAHLMVQSKLPCGWSDYILIHKQASLKEVNPEQPFYLLDDGHQPIPQLFYPMLNKCLALPLLAIWTDYLWESGRERKLITLLSEGAGQGYATWRVLSVLEQW